METLISIMARQNFIGLVVSQGKMHRTVKVRVETKVFNKSINKELFRRKDYLVHDEMELSREGDLVRIEATRPLSKRKFFSIAEIIKNKGQQFALFESQAKTNVAKEETAKTEEFLKRRQEREENNSILLKDIHKIQNALSKGETSQEIAEIKERYGIQDFSPAALKELLKLDIVQLENEVSKQQSAIDEISSQLKELLRDEEKATELLKSKGVENPASLKKNIRKNLLKKYIMQEALQ